MKNETAIARAEHYRLMLLVEHLQRQGRSEEEINSSLREIANDRVKTVGGS